MEILSYVKVCITFHALQIARQGRPTKKVREVAKPSRNGMALKPNVAVRETKWKRCAIPGILSRIITRDDHPE